MAQTKRLERIPGMDENDYAVIKKFSYGEATTIRSKGMKLHINSKNPNASSMDLDLYELNMCMLLAGIKEASFVKPEWTEAEKRKFIDEDLPAEAGEYLFEHINSFNNPDNKEAKK